MPLYGFLILFHYDFSFDYILPDEVQDAILKVVIASTIIFPLLTVVVYKLSGLILTYDMKTRQERRFPFLITALFYMFGYYLLRRLSLPPVFYKVMLGATLSVTIAVILNLFWKVSVHLIGIGGIIGTLLALSQLLLIDVKAPIIIALLLAGIIGSARMTVGEHTPAQIYTGVLVGFLCEFGMLWVKHV